MPQHRTLLQDAVTLKVERVLQQAQRPQWSPLYEVATPRLVLPLAGTTEFRVGDALVLLDSITLLSLPTGQPYQMKPFGVAARTSIVVSAQPGGTLPLAAATQVLTPRAVWHLRWHWRKLARGDAPEDSTTAVLQGSLASAIAGVGGAGPSWMAVQRARWFMAQRVADPHAEGWTLQDVADAACCSAFHLARSFRRYTGLSLHAWRQRLRLAQALQRLEAGERDLAALAHDLGFSSQSHLGAAFRSEIGATPAQVRRGLAA